MNRLCSLYYCVVHFFYKVEEAVAVLQAHQAKEAAAAATAMTGMKEK